MTSRRPIGEREAIRHAAAVVGSSGPTLRKSQRPCGRLQNCMLLADYWRGECLALGWWWRVSQKSYIPSQPYEIAKNGKKTGGFTHVLACNSRKTPFFALKYLTRYTHETFFQEHTNFEGYYLSRCRDIPLQSFGSHICPQPHGLGLIAIIIVWCCVCQCWKYIILSIYLSI